MGSALSGLRSSNLSGSPTLNYAVAALALAVATLARWLLDPALGDHLPYVTYFVAVAFVAWWGGLGASLFVLLVGWWLAEFFFLSPRYTWYPHASTPSQLVGAAAYFMVALSSVAVCEEMRRAQLRANREREFFRVMVSSIGDAVITTDREGRVTSQNRVASDLTGWAEEDATGRPLEEVFHIINEQSRKTAENPVGTVLATGKVINLANHITLIGKDGREHAIEDSAAPIRDSQGDILGVVLVFRDVTEQRRLDQALEASEARKSAILDTALDSIITIDHEGKIVDFNPAAARTFGFDQSAVVGREMVDLIVPVRLRAAHRAGFTRYLATGEGRVLNQRLELSAVHSNGTEFPVELAITRIAGGGRPLFTGHLRDITARKRAEERQLLLTNELNHRVKNTLAVVQSLSMRTLSDERSLSEARDILIKRLHALARVHELLIRTDWKGVPLKDIVAAEFEPFGDRAQISGPPLVIDGRMVQTLALVVHELVTNAAKHGSLSRDRGSVSIAWSIEGSGKDARFKLEWRERGGPPVGPPSRKGFGSTLLESAITSEFKVRPHLSYKPDGFVYILDIPLMALVADT